MKVVDGIRDGLECDQIADTDTHTAKEGHILWRIANPEGLFIFQKDNILHPMQIIFNTPMVPQKLYHFLCAELLTGDTANRLGNFCYCPILACSGSSPLKDTNCLYLGEFVLSRQIGTEFCIVGRLYRRRDGAFPFLLLLGIGIPREEGCLIVRAR